MRALCCWGCSLGGKKATAPLACTLHCIALLTTPLDSCGRTLACRRSTRMKQVCAPPVTVVSNFSCRRMNVVLRPYCISPLVLHYRFHVLFEIVSKTNCVISSVVSIRSRKKYYTPRIHWHTLSHTLPHTFTYYFQLILYSLSHFRTLTAHALCSGRLRRPARVRCFVRERGRRVSTGSRDTFLRPHQSNNLGHRGR